VLEDFRIKDKLIFGKKGPKKCGATDKPEPAKGAVLISRGRIKGGRGGMRKMGTEPSGYRGFLHVGLRGQVKGSR